MELRNRNIKHSSDADSRSDINPAVVKLGISAKFQSRLSLVRRPFACFTLFLQACYNFLKWILRQWTWLLFIFIMLPVIATWVLVDVPETHPFSVFRIDILTMLWWVVLGVIANLGIGTRIPTAFLFLVPNIWSIYESRLKCHNMDFDWRLNMSVTRILGLYKCGTRPRASHSLLLWHAPNCPHGPVPDALYEVFLYALPSFFLYGLGTALASLPTYYASLFSKKKANSKEYRLIQRSIDDQAKSCLLMDLAPAARKYGSIAVCFISIVPCMCNNIGFVSGFEGISCFKFLAARILGGVLVKMSAQCAALAAFFHYGLHKRLWQRVSDFVSESQDVSAFIADTVLPFVHRCQPLQAIHRHVMTCKKLAILGATSTIDRYWLILLCLVFGWWAVSFVTQIAKIQEELNSEAKRQPLKKSTKPTGVKPKNSDSEVPATPELTRTKGKRTRSFSPELRADKMETPRQPSRTRDGPGQRSKASAISTSSDQVPQSAGPVRRSERIRIKMNGDR